MISITLDEKPGIRREESSRFARLFQSVVPSLIGRERIRSYDPPRPSPLLTTEETILSRTIDAVPVEHDEFDRANLGNVTQLHPGTKFVVYGEGFNTSTVRVRCETGEFYCVFA